MNTGRLNSPHSLPRLTRLVKHVENYMIVSQFFEFHEILPVCKLNTQQRQQQTPHYLRSSRRKAASNRVKKSLHPYEDY